MQEIAREKLHRLCRDVLQFDKLGFWICLGHGPVTVRYGTQDYLEIEDIEDQESFLRKVFAWSVYQDVKSKAEK